MNKILGVALAGCMAVLAGNATAAEVEPKGAISITIDDGRRSSFIHGQPIFHAYGLKGTLYLTVGEMLDTTQNNDPWGVMSWAEAKFWADLDGWEIGAHTITHTALPDLTTTGLQAELGYAAALIYKKLGIYPTTFAAPFGNIDDSAKGERAGEVEAMIKELYDSHAWWGGGSGPYGFNSTTDIDPYRIGRYEIKRDTNPVETCKVITRAADEGAWVVLVLHGITQDPFAEGYGAWDSSADTVQKIAQCAGKLVADNRLRTGTVSEILSTIPFKNGQADTGGTETGMLTAQQ